MENIVRLSPSAVTTLMERLAHADLTGASVRIMTGMDMVQGTYIKYDIGNTGWTPPIYGEIF